MRAALLAVAGAAALTGGTLILSMPLAPVIKGVFAWLWLCSAVLEVRAMARGMRRLRRVRVAADGDVRGVSAEGDVEPLRLLSGSLVLARVAWLRIRFADGCPYGELLIGDADRCEQWRRLQLIWRQGPPDFGRPEGS